MSQWAQSSSKMFLTQMHYLCILLGYFLVTTEGGTVFSNHVGKKSVGSTNTENHERATKTSGCKLTLQDDLMSTKEPIIFTDDYKIVRPEVEGGKGVIHIDESQKLLLSCSGLGNKQKISKKPTASLQCDRGRFSVGGKTLKQNNGLWCFKSYAGSVLNITQTECGLGSHTGQIIEIGFKVANEWRPEIRVCHNIEKMSTLFSSHKLYGHSLSGAVQYSGRTSFTKGNKELFKNLSPDKSYSKNSQIDTFNELLGTGSGKKYITDANYLARGHLAPDADFIFVSEQLMTYYYVNVVPQWQPFNAGNWLTVEKDIRKLAKQVDKTLNVVTGSYGILKLPPLKGMEKEIFLDSKKEVIPVPEVMWKIVSDPDTRQCIVAVGHNHIYLTTPPKPLCDPITTRGWRILDDLTKGYTYYCDYPGFIKIVPYAPTLSCITIFELQEN